MTLLGGSFRGGFIVRTCSCEPCSHFGTASGQRESAARPGVTGLHLLARAAVLFAAAAVCAAGPPAEDTTSGLEWCGFMEAGIGIGRMDRTVDGRQEELFGVEVLRSGGEQDAFTLRAGFGRGFGDDILLMAYGGIASLPPGVFFDNHGPFIPPELTYSITEASLGLELRSGVFRTGAGCGIYSGVATLRPDQREGEEPGERWEGDLGVTAGPQMYVGFSGSAESCFADPGLGLVWRYIPVELPETPTGVTPEVYWRHMIELNASIQLFGYVL